MGSKSKVNRNNPIYSLEMEIFNLWKRKHILIVLRT